MPRLRLQSGNESLQNEADFSICLQTFYTCYKVNTTKTQK